MDEEDSTPPPKVPRRFDERSAPWLEIEGCVSGLIGPPFRVVPVRCLLVIAWGRVKLRINITRVFGSC